MNIKQLEVAITLEVVAKLIKMYRTELGHI